MKFFVVLRFKNSDFKILLLMQTRLGGVSVLSVKVSFAH